jgi:hypothetical protein
LRQLTTLASKKMFPMLGGGAKPVIPAQNGGRGTNKKTTATGRKRNGVRNMADFVPSTDGGLQGWLVNLKTTTPNRGLWL